MNRKPLHDNSLLVLEQRKIIQAGTALPIYLNKKFSGCESPCAPTDGIAFILKLHEGNVISDHQGLGLPRLGIEIS
jgi:hypothetical protein